MGLFNFFKQTSKNQQIDEMKYLIVGLGNVGEEYEDTRHNIGFMVLDRLAKDHSATFSLQRHAFVAEMSSKGRTLVLIKPTTFMNLSGKALRYWMDKEKIKIENVLIIVDDLALPLGTLRLKKNGSAGGHNGLTNIAETLGHQNYARLRFGIGSEFSKGRQVDFVLGKWKKDEQEVIGPKIDMACEMILSFVFQGVDKTMNAYNNK